MSPVSQPKLSMTLEEFYQWQSDPDLRYELFEGVPRAMTAPKWPHRRLVTRLARLISEALDVRPPCAIEAEVGILSPSRPNTFYQADLAVSCTPPSDERVEMAEPLLIIEVLSSSTEEKDRKVKLVDYRRIPSVQEILLVDSTRRYCELHRRIEGDRWLTELLVDPEALVHLNSIKADLSLDRIYANLEFEQ